jgi:hypothetical protein
MSGGLSPTPAHRSRNDQTVLSVASLLEWWPMMQKRNWLFLVLWSVVALLGCHNVGGTPPNQTSAKPLIRKLGTIDVALVETTPFVFNDKLYRFEWVRADYAGNTLGDHYRILDTQTGQTLSTFAKGHCFGSAFVDGDTVWVFGVDKGGGNRIDAYWSKDLKAWESQKAIELPGWGLFNNSVCRGPDGFIMAIEVGSPPEVVGTAFTTRFLKSRDLRKWELLPEPAVYTKDRYSACPTILYLGGTYYMIYLEAMPAWHFETYIVRSRDLIRWELSPRNPVLRADANDKKIASTKLTPEQRQRITGADDINNSDLDLVEFNGRVVINYSWGNQKGIEFLAEAVYDGTLESFLKAWFPE